MKAYALLTFIQFRKLGRNNPSIQSFHNEDIVTKNEPISQSSLNGNFLIKQCDRLYQFFVRFTETSQEPKVTWKYNRQGRSHFEIYDPFTKQYHNFDSEQDALIWLDKDRFKSTSRSYYQQFNESDEKLSNKHRKSFDYLGRR